MLAHRGATECLWKCGQPTPPGITLLVGKGEIRETNLSSLGGHKGLNVGEHNGVAFIAAAALSASFLFYRLRFREAT